jgi:hypothetical protein
MEQSSIQGVNQQERLLCWLGGIIDGEGCITINHHRLHKQTKKETLLFAPIIVICNTDKSLIDTCKIILSDNNIPFYIQYQPSSQTEKFKSSNGGPRKDRWYLRIEGIKRVARALNILSHYVLIKKDETRLVKEFCDRRLQKNPGFHGTPPYDGRDFEIIEEVARIHNRHPQRLHAEILEYKSRNKI